METVPSWHDIFQGQTEPLPSAMKHKPTHLRFLFLFRERQFKPLPGLSEPSGPVCVMRSMPGNVWAWGPDRETVTRRLQSKLEAEFKKRNSPEAWYAEQLENLPRAMDPAELREVVRVLFEGPYKRVGDFEVVQSQDQASTTRCMAAC